MNIEVLKTAKERLGISYDEIARRSGVPKATVTNVMCGYTKRPRIDTIQKIQTALGITDEMWTAEDYADGVTDTKKVSITADQEDVLDKYKEVESLLGEKGKNLVIEFCDVLIEKFKR